MTGYHWCSVTVAQSLPPEGRRLAFAEKLSAPDSVTVGNLGRQKATSRLTVDGPDGLMHCSATVGPSKIMVNLPGCGRLLTLLPVYVIIQGSLADDPRLLVFHMCTI